MAVVKLNFIPRGKTAKAQAKETLGYNGSRPGYEKEEIDRMFFGHGGEYTGKQALQIIDEAPASTYFFRMIVSPDPKTENKDRNLDLRLLTTQLVEWLETRLNREIPFIGAEHDDHTKIPHIHAIALIQRRGREMLIDRDTIDALRAYATKMTRQQNQELTEEIKLNPTKENYIEKPVAIAGGKAIQVFKQSPVNRLPQQTHSCTNCQARQSVIKLRSGIMYCKTCKKVQKDNQLKVDRDRGFELSL